MIMLNGVKQYLCYHLFLQNMVWWFKELPYFVKISKCFSNYKFLICGGLQVNSAFANTERDSGILCIAVL